MQGPIRAGSVAAPRDCRAQPAWLRGHSLPDKSRDTTAEMCEARINRRAGSVTHDATAGANQLQRQDRDRLGIDTFTIRRLRTASPSITGVIAFVLVTGASAARSPPRRLSAVATSSLVLSMKWST